MAESKCNLTSIQRYINMTDQELAKLFLVRKPERALNFDDLVTKINTISQTKNPDGSIKYFYVSSIPDVEYTFFIDKIFKRWGGLVGDPNIYGLNLENVVALYNKILSDNWTLLNGQISDLNRQFLRRGAERNKTATVNFEMIKSIFEILELINIQKVNLSV